MPMSSFYLLKLCDYIGKTQVCMSLAVQCSLETFKKLSNDPSRSEKGLISVAYLTCGEGAYPIRRLQQMVTATVEQHHASHRNITREASGKHAGLSQRMQSADMGSESTELTEDSLLSNIAIEACSNIDQLISSLFGEIPKMCRENHMAMIIIDRFEYKV